MDKYPFLNEIYFTAEMREKINTIHSLHTW